MKEKKALCICASGMRNDNEEGVSRRISKILEETLVRKRILAEIVELQKASLIPCSGCGRCADGRLCREDADFNRIYQKIIEADYLFLVSPHHAPVPSRLCMLLEKMERFALLCRQKEPSGEPELWGKLAGIISHAGGGERELMICKAMVNDTIADALDAVGVKVVPFNSRWNTGISFAAPEKKEEGIKGEGIFSAPEYDWRQIEEKTGMYVEIVVQTSRTLYAIL